MRCDCAADEDSKVFALHSYNLKNRKTSEEELENQFYNFIGTLFRLLIGLEDCLSSMPRAASRMLESSDSDLLMLCTSDDKQARERKAGLISLVKLFVSRPQSLVRS